MDNPNMDRGKPPLRRMSREAASAGLHLQGNDSKWDWETLGAVTESLTWVWWLFEGLPIKRLRYSAPTRTTNLCVLFEVFAMPDVENCFPALTLARAARYMTARRSIPR